MFIYVRFSAPSAVNRTQSKILGRRSRRTSLTQQTCCLNQGRIAMQTRSILRPRIVLLLLVPLLLAACAGATKAPAAKAPTVLQGDFRVHDPSIIQQDGAYYVFSTGDEGGLNHGTIQIRRSTDLTSWK